MLPKSAHDAHSSSMLLGPHHALVILLRGSCGSENWRHVLVFEEGSQSVPLGVNHAAKVNQLNVSILVQKNIVWLKVAVHQSHLMKMDKSQRNFSGVKFHPLDGETTIILPQGLV